MTSTFDELWRTAVRTHGARDFLTFRHPDETDAAWTYTAFEAIIADVAAALRSRGVLPGTSIHLCLRNCPAFIAVWLAAARIGANIVPVDPTSSVRDLTRQFTRTTPVLGLTYAEQAADYRQAAGADLPVIVLSETAADLAADAPLRTPATGAQKDGAQEDAAADQRPQPADRLAVMFTSGTTSEPKGVVLTQANYAYVGRTMAELAALTPTHRWLVVLPLFHANAQYYCFASAIAAGASVALVDRFSASGWVRQAAELSATHASLFAAPIRMILARTPEDAPPLALTHVWYAQNLSRGHFEALRTLCGVAPRQLYGMTETTAVVCADRSGSPQHDSIGTVVPGRRIALISPVTGAVAEAGEPGLLHLAGHRGEDLFAGYLDNPQATDAAFDARAVHAALPEEGTAQQPEQQPDWFCTGDLLAADEHGALRFVGRADDVIKVAGENVSLTEVEAALAEAPGVLEVAVIAVPDEIRDVVTSAYVVPADPDTPPTIDALTAFAAANLPKAARPQHWQLTAALPRTSVGKIRRFALTQPGGPADSQAPHTDRPAAKPDAPAD